RKRRYKPRVLQSVARPHKKRSAPRDMKGFPKLPGKRPKPVQQSPKAKGKREKAGGKKAFYFYLLPFTFCLLSAFLFFLSLAGDFRAGTRWVYHAFQAA